MEDVLDQGTVADLDERIRPIGGERTEPGAATGGGDDGVHGGKMDRGLNTISNDPPGIEAARDWSWNSNLMGVDRGRDLYRNVYS